MASSALRRHNTGTDVCQGLKLKCTRKILKKIHARLSISKKLKTMDKFKER